MAKRQGWSLIELLVVLAIISILGVISIPIMRSFARDDMRNGARTVYTMLRAARIYAMSYNVETAVVYELDNDFLSGTPMEDSLRNMQVRCIRAAQVMYRLPDEFGLRPSYELDVAAMGLNVDTETVSWEKSGTFVPAPISAGEQVVFADGYSLLLEKPAPEYDPNRHPIQAYSADSPSVNLAGRIQGGDLGAAYLSQYHPQLDQGKIKELGMTPVYVYTGGINYNIPEERPDEILRARREPFDGLGMGVHLRMAHVFVPRGNLKIYEGPERYTLLFGPSPDTFWSERIWFVGTEPDDLTIFNWLNPPPAPVPQPQLSEGGGNLIGIPIEIHRATGRATLGS